MGGKGSQKGQSGGGAAGAKMAKRRVGKSRVEGVITHWQKTWGWVTPSAPIKHPEAKKNGGRIYVARSDLGRDVDPAVDVLVNFLVYCDERGLGGDDVHVSAMQDDGGADDEEGELPEGWEKHWSVEKEAHYYWHRPTKQTTWERPQGEAPLPKGWTKQFDSEKSEWYYWHAATKTSQWEPPGQEAGAEAAGGAHEEAAADAAEAEAAEEAAASAPVLGQRRIQGIVTKWQGFSGWVSPLQDLGEDQPSKIYCSWRDVKGGIKLKVGLHVDFLLAPDDAGLRAVEVRLASKDGEEENAGDDTDPALDKLQREWAEQDRKLGLAAPQKEAEDETFGLAEAGAGAEDEGEGVLLPGWKAIWSEENQCNYYWHALTKQSSWERPAVPAEEDEEEAQDRGDEATDRILGGKVWEGEGSEQGAARTATPMTPLLDGQAGRQLTPATPAAGKMKTASTNAVFTAARARGVVRTTSGRSGGASIPSWIPVKRQRAF